MTTLILIYLIFHLPVFTVQNVCSWSSWSSEIKCQWVSYQCINGYQRHCLCDNVISMGSACEKKLQNYIQTKPFASNFISPPHMCYKHNCPKFKNWCPWESWSYWHPVSNTTCERRRSRKCCENQPKSGYTNSLSTNYGCFISKSQQNSTDFQVDFKEMQCSSYTMLYTIAIYTGIGIGCLIIFIIICGLTRSSYDKIKSISKPEEISIGEIVNHNVPPTAPIDEIPFIQPIINDTIKEPFISTSGLPITPPSYDETIGFSNFSEPAKYTTVPITEKLNEDDSKTVSRRSSSEAMTTRANTENIPPPSYALYSRNPNLFNQDH